MATAAKTQLGKGWEGEVKIVHKAPVFTKLEGTEVNETQSYDFFQFDKKNRPVSEEKVHFFMKQFKEGKFFMKDFPAIVRLDGTVLDGQHRVEACKRMGLPVYFRIAIDLTVDKIADVQVNAGWKTNDFMHAFIKQGKQDYVVLQRFVKRYNLSLSVAIMIVAGRNGGDGLKATGFYEGAFKVKDETEAHRVAKIISEVGELALKLNRDASFCRAVMKIIAHPDYDHKRMVAQLEKHVSLMRRQHKIDDYVRNLEEIFNYRAFTKNKVRFL